MGFIKRVFGGKQATPDLSKMYTAKSADSIAAETEKKRRTALIAANEGAGTTQSLGSTQPATTRKTVFGL